MPPQKRTAAPAAVFVPPAVAPPVETPVPAPPTPPVVEGDAFQGVAVYGAEDFRPARANIPVSPTVLKLAEALSQHGRLAPVVDGWDAAKINLFRKQLSSPACEALYGGRKIRFTAGTVDGKQALRISLSDPPAAPDPS